MTPSSPSRSMLGTHHGRGGGALFHSGERHRSSETEGGLLQCHVPGRAELPQFHLCFRPPSKTCCCASVRNASKERLCSCSRNFHGVSSHLCSRKEMHDEIEDKHARKRQLPAPFYRAFHESSSSLDFKDCGSAGPEACIKILTLARLFTHFSRRCFLPEGLQQGGHAPKGANVSPASRCLKSNSFTAV